METQKMDRNRLFFFICITGIFVLWMQFNRSAQQEELEKQKQIATQDTVRIVDTLRTTVVESKSSLGEKGSAQYSSVADVVENNIPDQELVVETPYYRVVMQNKGGTIQSLLLKELKSIHSEEFPMVLSSEKGSVLGLSFGDQDLSQSNWTLEAPKLTKENGIGDKAIVYTLNASGDETLDIAFSIVLRTGEKVVRTYTFEGATHDIHHKVTVENSFDGDFAILWGSGLIETEELPAEGGLIPTQNIFNEFVFSNGESVSREALNEQAKFNDQEGSVRWFGTRKKYAAAIVNFGKGTEHILRVAPVGTEEEISSQTHTYAIEVDNTGYQNGALDFKFLVVPLKYSELKEYGEKYERILFSGYEWFLRADIWYVKLCGLILNLLNWFYGLIPNYGVAIILLTLLVRFILFPLTAAQTRSMSKLQEHAPALKEIREKNKGNAQKTQAEMMAYYRKNGVNPAGGLLGCLPMFLQFPVFIALFNVLSRAVELKEQPFLLWVSDLSRPDVITSAVTVPWIYPEGITILPLFMAVTMYFQTKMTITDPNQKAMVWMMPIMMFIFSSSFPSGLVLYWTVSNVFTIAQTALLKKNKKPVVTTAPVGPSKTTSSKKNK
jgi:YidC/Oxa1 family membrane protein insertase